jgi:Protein of unknown function (DUF1360)
MAPDVDTRTVVGRDTAPDTGLQARQPFRGYSSQDRALGEYAALIAGFATSFGVAMAAARRRRGELPERIAPGDVVMAGVATQKLSRLIAKDRVTSVVRAPFTREEALAPSTPEVDERPRGRRLRRAVGELLTCPFCLSQWVAGGFTAGLLLAPRPTRVVVAMFDMVAMSDFLQVAYKAAENRKSPE